MAAAAPAEHPRRALQAVHDGAEVAGLLVLAPVDRLLAAPVLGVGSCADVRLVGVQRPAQVESRGNELSHLGLAEIPAEILLEHACPVRALGDARIPERLHREVADPETVRDGQQGQPDLSRSQAATQAVVRLVHQHQPRVAERVLEQLRGRAPDDQGERSSSRS